MELSVIIPVYNQEKNLEKNLNTLKEYLDTTFKEFEIIAVNDGSTDKSLEILKSLGFIRLVSYSENKGKGYAVRRGVMAAKGEFVFFTDADLSYSPEEIYRGVRILRYKKPDGIIGIRNFKKSKYPPLRRLASDVFSTLVKRVLNLDIKDSQCGFKGFKKACARNIFSSLSTFRFGFDTELLLTAKLQGLKIQGINVSFTHFPSESIKPFKDSGEMFFSLLKLKLRSLRLEKYRYKK